MQLGLSAVFSSSKHSPLVYLMYEKSIAFSNALPASGQCSLFHFTDVSSDHSSGRKKLLGSKENRRKRSSASWLLHFDNLNILYNIVYKMVLIKPNDDPKKRVP